MRQRAFTSVLLGVLVSAAALAAAVSPATLRAAGPVAARFSIDIGGSELVFSKGSGFHGTATSGGSIVLERGTGTSELLSWAQTGARRNVTLVLYASDGTPVARYYLENAWPAKIEIGAPKASALEVAYETVTLFSAIIIEVGFPK